MKLSQILKEIDAIKIAIATLKDELDNTQAEIEANELKIENCQDEDEIDTLIDLVQHNNSNLKKQKVKINLKIRNQEAKLTTLEGESLVQAKLENEALAAKYCDELETIAGAYRTACKLVMNIDKKLRATLNEAAKETGLGFRTDGLNNPKLYSVEGTLNREQIGSFTRAEMEAGIKPIIEERLKYSFVSSKKIEAEEI
ncbi:hypothetical protein [Pleurocapsa sp. FMAR1]|uniref:hypothetical protein n=1 Tax=Pleurocapsa sp. FMAR1 TaxID=3040204 RepID=UPI0029C88FC9|nr:hypothetical protein [Pleurocapsa sp. FMAR1]